MPILASDKEAGLYLTNGKVCFLNQYHQICFWLQDNQTDRYLHLKHAFCYSHWKDQTWVYFSSSFISWSSNINSSTSLRFFAIHSLSTIMSHSYCENSGKPNIFQIRFWIVSSLSVSFRPNSLSLLNLAIFSMISILSFVPSQSLPP